MTAPADCSNPPIAQPITLCAPGMAVDLIKQLLQVIVAWSADKPQYGAFRATAGGLDRPAAVDQRALCVCSHRGGISDRRSVLPSPAGN